MRVKLQLVLYTDDGHEETVPDIITWQKDSQRFEPLGLTLTEAKELLTTIQPRVLTKHVDAFLASHGACAPCGAILKSKGVHARRFRTLFGTFPLASPRLYRCPLEETSSQVKSLRKAVEALRTYIENNRNDIPNYGERYRCGEAMATGFVESTVNQVVSQRFCTKQHMQWSKRGAHLRLQTRIKTLNGDLASVFKRWYPALQLEEESQAA